jgi:uncharacterized membrane protein
VAEQVGPARVGVWGVSPEADSPQVSGAAAAAGSGTNRHLEFIFLAFALVWGIAQVFLVPPLQVPDEGDHWFRAWALTDGQLTADKEGMLTLPGGFTRTVNLYTRLINDHTPLPVSLAGEPGFAGYEDLFNGPPQGGTIKVASRVASYGPVGFLPPALGIAVGRLAGAPPLTSFYLGRLTNLLVAVTLLFFAIRIAPFGKQLFVLVALLPMTMFELASVALDALTISGAIFFIALTLWASKRTTLRRVDLALILAAAAVLLNVKPGYQALLLLLFLIRPSQLGGRTRYLGFVAACSVAVAGVLLVTTLGTATAARALAGGGVPGQPVTGPLAQVHFIVSQPFAFLEIVGSSLQLNLLSWTYESVGALGWIQIFFHKAFYLLVFVAIPVFMLKMRDEVHVRLGQRALLALAGVAVFLTIAAALYVFLEPVGSPQVVLQGRYLAPVWLLLLLSAYGVRFARQQLGVAFLIVVLLVIMTQNLYTIVSHYYV